MPCLLSKFLILFFQKNHRGRRLRYTDPDFTKNPDDLTNKFVGSDRFGPTALCVTMIFISFENDDTHCFSTKIKLDPIFACVMLYFSRTRIQHRRISTFWQKNHLLCNKVRCCRVHWTRSKILKRGFDHLFRNHGKSSTHCLRFSVFLRLPFEDNVATPRVCFECYAKRIWHFL